MQIDKILHEVLGPPENMVDHIKRATYSADQTRNASKYCIILF